MQELRAIQENENSILHDQYGPQTLATHLDLRDTQQDDSTAQIRSLYPKPPTDQDIINSIAKYDRRQNYILIIWYASAYIYIYI